MEIDAEVKKLNKKCDSSYYNVSNNKRIMRKKDDKYSIIKRDSWNDERRAHNFETMRELKKWCADEVENQVEQDSINIA